MSASVEWRRTCVYTVVPVVTPLRIARSQHPLVAVVKVTFGCTRVALVKRQPQDNLGLLSP